MPVEGFWLGFHRKAAESQKQFAGQVLAVDFDGCAVVVVFDGCQTDRHVADVYSDAVFHLSPKPSVVFALLRVGA